MDAVGGMMSVPQRVGLQGIKGCRAVGLAVLLGIVCWVGISVVGSPAEATVTLEYLSGPAAPAATVVYCHSSDNMKGPSRFFIGVNIVNNNAATATNVSAAFTLNGAGIGTLRDPAADGTWTYGYGERVVDGKINRGFLSPLAPYGTYTAYYSISYPLINAVARTFTVTAEMLVNGATQTATYAGTLTTSGVSPNAVGALPSGTVQGAVGGIVELVINYDSGTLNDFVYWQPAGDRGTSNIGAITFDASKYRLVDVWGTWTSGKGNGTFTNKLYKLVENGVFGGNSTKMTVYYRFLSLASGQAYTAPFHAPDSKYNMNFDNQLDAYISMIGSLTLTMSKTVDYSTITPTGTLAYTIVYKNNSGSDTVNFIVTTDVIPGSTIYIPNSASGNGTYSPSTNKITWDIGTVGTNTTGTLTFQVKVNNVSGDTIITNITGLYIADNPDPTLNATATTTVFNVNPQIQIISPNGSEYWGGTRTISWTAYDDNGTTTLNYVLEYSTGTTWGTITTGTVSVTASIGTNTYDWNTTGVNDGT